MGNGRKGFRNKREKGGNREKKQRNRRSDRRDKRMNRRRQRCHWYRRYSRWKRKRLIKLSLLLRRIIRRIIERRVKLTRKEFRLRKRRATDWMSVCMRIMIKMASIILSVEMRRRFMMGIKAKITRRCEIILVQKIRSGRRQWYMGRCQRRFKRRRHMVNWGNGFVVTVSRRSHL